MASRISPDELVKRIAINPQKLGELEYSPFISMNMKKIKQTYGTGFVKAVNYCLDPHCCSSPANDRMLYKLVANYLTVDEQEIREYVRRKQSCECNEARLTLALQETCKCMHIRNIDKIRRSAYRDRYTEEDERQAFIMDLEELRADNQDEAGVSE